MMDKIKILLALVVGVVFITGCVEKPNVTTTTTTGEPGLHPDYCKIDDDCVPAQCCHPTSCINKKFAPDCSGSVCTEVCDGPIDCGAGRCACMDNKCVVENLNLKQEAIK